VHKKKIFSRESVYFHFFISPWFFGFLIFTLWPIIQSIYISSTDWEMQLNVVPKFIGMANYKNLLFNDELFWISLKNTFYYAFGSVPLGLILALILALLLNQKLRGITIFRTIFYLPSVISGVAVALLWVWIFNPQFGIVNAILAKLGLPTPGWLTDPAWAMPALIIMSLWGVGGSMLIFLAGLQGIPTEFYEAAEIDGAKLWAKFRYITLPMLSPTIFFNLVMGIIGSFQIFTNVYIMTSGGPGTATLVYVLYLFQNAFLYFKMGYASAMAWILFVIILTLTLLVIKSSAFWVYYETEVKR